jgi:alkylated DNA nucleotide flippase Atl1
MPSPASWKPGPAPEDLTETIRLLVKLANLVPAGHWVTYGDLGEAAGMGPASKSARGVASALSFAPTETPPSAWALPWHRVRMEDGHLKSRSIGVIKDPFHHINVLFTDEGGRLIGAAASEGRRFPMAALIRTGKLKL